MLRQNYNSLYPFTIIILVAMPLPSDLFGGNLFKPLCIRSECFSICVMIMMFKENTMRVVFLSKLVLTHINKTLFCAHCPKRVKIVIPVIMGFFVGVCALLPYFSANM